MKKHFSLLIVVIILTGLLSDCARRNRPSGGPKDEDPPTMISARPSDLTTNFKEDEIKIYFDEYIKLKELNTQLIVSPPLKYPPVIEPLGTPSKYISIKILDTLKENTTYTFNFGQSVVDNSEGNILNNFKYVFSTGDVIDSLKVSGSIKDAFNKDADRNITVMLYEINKAFTDSIIYNEKPLYVANSLDTTSWEITNIKPGEYLLLGLKDVGKNYKFNPKQDKIGFIKEHITVPTESNYLINLFKEDLDYKLTRPSEAGKGHIFVGYEGVADSLKIFPLAESSTFRSFSNFERGKDTLNFWYKGNSKDSLQLKVTNKNYNDTIIVKLRTKTVDSLQITGSTRGILNLRDQFKLLSNTPIQSIDTAQIYFIDNDSVKVPFTYKISQGKDEIKLDFTKKFNERYRLEILPNAITDFFGNVNDTLKYSLSTKEPIDYGQLYLTLQNVKRYPLIVQLITEKGDLIEEVYAEEEQEYAFLNLVPARYLVRIIFDDNKNKKRDTGSFLLKKQPEKVIYFDIDQDIRANWVMTETFILK